MDGGNSCLFIYLFVSFVSFVENGFRVELQLNLELFEFHCVPFNGRSRFERNGDSL